MASLQSKPGVAALRLQPGAAVEYDGQPAIIEQVLDMQSVLIARPGSAALQCVPIDSLRPAGAGEPPGAVPELNAVSVEAWAQAKKKG